MAGEDDTTGANEGQRISREHADAKEQEAKVAGSALLDTIEDSKKDQGDYFLKFGVNGNAIEPGNDNRVIVFKTPISVASENGFSKRAVVITQDGPFTVYTGEHPNSKPDFDNFTDEFMKRAGELQMGGINKGSYSAPDANGIAHIYTAGYGSHEASATFNLEPITDSSIVITARDESIKNTEAPHKARMGQAQARIDSIRSLSESMSQLPPRA